MLKGVITPIVTLFDQFGKIDYEAESRLIDFLISNRVDGILFMGSTGDFPYLSTDERKQFTKFAVDYVGGRVAVLIGTGSTSGKEALELTQWASKAGADRAVVVTPYYFNYNDDTYYKYFEFLGYNSDVPLIIYNYPNLTGYNIKPQLFREIVLNIPQIVGIKDTIDSLSHLRAIIHVSQSVNRDIEVFCGFDEYLMDTLSLGGSGVIGGLSNFAPEVLKGVYDAYKDGDLSTIEQRNCILSRLMKLYGLWQPGSVVIKEAMYLRGIIDEINLTVRQPAMRMPCEHLEELKLLLNALMHNQHEG